MSNKVELPLLVHFESLAKDIMERTEIFPKRPRSTLGERIERLVLDIIELIIEVRFTGKSQQNSIFKKINIDLEKLRVLLRLAYSRHFINIVTLEHLARRLNDIGRMVGGWARFANEKDGNPI